MPINTYYAHIAERLFGEWSEFLTGHGLPPEGPAPPAVLPEPVRVENEIAQAA
jgi:hypothetical protein